MHAVAGADIVAPSGAVASCLYSCLTDLLSDFVTLFCLCF